MLDFLTRIVAMVVASFYGYRFTSTWHVQHPSGEHVQLRVLVVRRPPLGFGGITIGRTLVTIASTYTHCFAIHEATHALQWKKLGVFFPLAYLYASLQALIGGGDKYRDNIFEVEARTYEQQECGK